MTCPVPSLNRVCQRLCDWIERTADASGCVPFALPSVNDYLLSSNEIEFDLTAPGYVHPPLDWAPAPIGFGHSFFDRAQLVAGLAVLANAQREDGGWTIKWPATTCSGSPSAKAWTRCGA